MAEICTIEINFAAPVDFPPGFEQALDALIGMVCKAYEIKHPDRTMWPAGFGAKPIWREPEEPAFDGSVYHINVAEREASERELQRRARN